MAWRRLSLLNHLPAAAPSPMALVAGVGFRQPSLASCTASPPPGVYFARCPADGPLRVTTDAANRISAQSLPRHFRRHAQCPPAAHAPGCNLPDVTTMVCSMRHGWCRDRAAHAGSGHLHSGVLRAHAPRILTASAPRYTNASHNVAGYRHRRQRYRRLRQMACGDPARHARPTGSAVTNGLGFASEGERAELLLTTSSHGCTRFRGAEFPGPAAGWQHDGVLSTTRSPDWALSAIVRSWCWRRGCCGGAEDG